MPLPRIYKNRISTTLAIKLRSGDSPRLKRVLLKFNRPWVDAAARGVTCHQADVGDLPDEGYCHSY